MPRPDTPSSLSHASSNPATAPSARSIFPKGPSFTIDNFQNQDFIVKDFVESLTDSALPTNRQSGPSSQAAFDPKPFIRAFEHALSRLSTLSEDLETQTTERQTNVRRAEAQHNQTLDSLVRKLDLSIDSFHKLDTSLNPSNGTINGHGDADAGGNAAVRIGEKLEELDKQRRRALDARFLIQCWTEVSDRGDLTSLEDVRRRGGGDGKVRCAVIARQLLRISQRLDQASWSQVTSGKRDRPGASEVNGTRDHHRNGHNTRELIEKFSETLEKDLLKQFDEFYRRQDFDGMRECSNVLYDFNGGASVVALFVNQHQFFIDRSQLITEEVEGDRETWERLADPDADPPGVEPSLQALIDEVKVVVQEESAIIKRAFPYYELVLGKFLQRVFQQSIQQRLELVLEKANSISSLAFLRSLQAARSSLNTLVEDLKAHGLTEHPDSISSQTSTVLDQQLDELFVPYLVGSSYIEREKKSLEELYSSLLFKFTIYHSRRKKHPQTFLSTLAQTSSSLLASAKESYLDRLDSSDLTPFQKTMLLRVAGLKDSGGKMNNANGDEIEVGEEDGVVDIRGAKRMLRWMAEGVGRGLELSPGGGDVARDVQGLGGLVVRHLGGIYVETALDAASDTATTLETSKSTPPDLPSFLTPLRSCIPTTSLLQTFLSTVLLPLASANFSVKREMEKQTSGLVKGVEEKVNGVLQRAVDVILNWVGRLLSTQGRSDYRPRDGAIGPLSPNLHLLNAHLLLPPLLHILLEHFKRFPVSPPGALMLTKDLTAYAEVLKRFPTGGKDGEGVAVGGGGGGGVTDGTGGGGAGSGGGGGGGIKARIDILGEVGTLFVLRGDVVAERLAGAGAGAGGGGAAAGRLSKEDVKVYLKMREDRGGL
ncbi:MAG: Exocyst complex component 5 [Caeruleum heppii]|nr:MAG: Exocyst complex component 5 [Caeruleum heppii]